MSTGGIGILTGSGPAIFQLTDEVTNILSRSLQMWFAEHPLAQEYRWNQNPAIGKIGIYDQFPDEPRKYPAITIKGMIGQTEESGFGQAAGELLDAEGAMVGERFAGWYNPRVEFQVESTYDADVRRIADLLICAIVRTLQVTVPRDTNGNVMFQLPNLLSVTSSGTRNDTNNRIIFYRGITSPLKVTWHDVRELPDTFLIAKRTVTITDY